MQTWRHGNWKTLVGLHTIVISHHETRFRGCWRSDQGLIFIFAVVSRLWGPHFNDEVSRRLSHDDTRSFQVLITRFITTGVILISHQIIVYWYSGTRRPIRMRAHTYFLIFGPFQDDNHVWFEWATTETMPWRLESNNVRISWRVPAKL